MALSAFADRSKKPRPAELKAVLRRSSAHWDELIKHIASEYAPLDKAWGFAGAKWGWSLRLRWKKRTVLYMTPCEGYFLAGFALGEKAVEAARVSGLSGTVLDIIDNAKRYAEGRGVRLEIRTKPDREQAKRLVAIKMAN